MGVCQMRGAARLYGAGCALVRLVEQLRDSSLKVVKGLARARYGSLAVRRPFSVRRFVRGCASRTRAPSARCTAAVRQHPGNLDFDTAFCSLRAESSPHAHLLPRICELSKDGSPRCPKALRTALSRFRSCTAPTRKTPHMRVRRECHPVLSATRTVAHPPMISTGATIWPGVALYQG
jgi:hypothetical protein